MFQLLNRISLGDNRTRFSQPKSELTEKTLTLTNAKANTKPLPDKC